MYILITLRRVGKKATKLKSKQIQFQQPFSQAMSQCSNYEICSYLQFSLLTDFVSVSMTTLINREIIMIWPHTVNTPHTLLLQGKAWRLQTLGLFIYFIPPSNPPTRNAASPETGDLLQWSSRSGLVCSGSELFCIESGLDLVWSGFSLVWSVLHLVWSILDRVWIQSSIVWSGLHIVWSGLHLVWSGCSLIWSGSGCGSG